MPATGVCERRWCLMQMRADRETPKAAEREMISLISWSRSVLVMRSAASERMRVRRRRRRRGLERAGEAMIDGIVELNSVARMLAFEVRVAKQGQSCAAVFIELVWYARQNYTRAVLVVIGWELGVGVGWGGACSCARHTSHVADAEWVRTWALAIGGMVEYNPVGRAEVCMKQK